MLKLIYILKEIAEKSKKTNVPVTKYFTNPPVGFLIGGEDKARKKSIKTKLNISQIEPTQEFVDLEGVKEYSKNPPTELPLVIKYNHNGEDRYFAVNHTRIAGQILNGKKEIDVMLVGFENGNFYKLK